MLVIVIFTIMLLITLVIILTHKTNKAGDISEYCNTDKDCSDGDICIANPQMNGKTQCFPSNTTFCQISPSTMLTSCDPNDINSCSMCNNNPPYSCVVVDKDNIYSWTNGNNKFNIPFSNSGKGWCLPKIVNNVTTCNPFVSDTVLVDTGNGYEWGCECKYPNLFDHSEGPTSDCTLVRACGETSGENIGKLYVPLDPVNCKTDSDCNTGDKCLKKLTGNLPCDTGVTIINNYDEDFCATPGNCVCQTPWTGDVVAQIHPFSGQCVCNKEKNLSYQCVQRSSDYYEMNCVKGKCPGYTVETDSSKCNSNKCYQDNNQNCECCDCPVGYIRCPDDIPDGNTTGLISWCQNNGPQCIPDPCANIPGGFWDNSLSPPQCNCSAIVNGGVINDESSVVGQICGDLCASDPCGGRGTCIVSNNVAQCCDCIYPNTNTGDTLCTCSILIPGTLKGQRCCNTSECVTPLTCNNGNDGSWDCPGINETTGEYEQPYGTCVGNYPDQTDCPSTGGTPKCVVNMNTAPVVCGTGSPKDGMCLHNQTCCSQQDQKTFETTWRCCDQDGATCCGNNTDNSQCCPKEYPVCGSTGCQAANNGLFMCDTNNPDITFKNECNKNGFLTTLVQT
jgi:hypothetical protein